MKKFRMILLALCCSVMLSGCAAGPSPMASPETSPTASQVPSPEPSPATDDLDVLALRAEDGEVLPESLLLAPVELSEVLEGNLTGYARLRADGWVFEWIRSDFWARDGEIGGWEQWFFISKETADGLACYVSIDELSVEPVEADRTLVYQDVDFDGSPDVLFCTGRRGNQGYLSYLCYLQREDGFEKCVSFANIENPAVDEENQLILSSWRNMATSHSWGMYVYQDDKYVLTRVLTEDALYDSEGEIVWQWTEGGKVICRSDENTEEEIDDLIYNENSEWGLQTDRWHNL